MTRWSSLLILVSVLASACSPKYVRDTDVPDLDKPAMSTGLDRADLDRLFNANIQNLLNSPAMMDWQQAAKGGKKTTVAIFPIQNDTTEHIDTQLNALLSKLETQLVGTGAVRVVSRERQQKLAEELRLQESAVFDQAQASKMGRMLGAKQYVTGKIYDSAERTKKARRVQYFLFMQVVDVETSEVTWQNEASLSKGLLK
jgi:penicillin-binding protein activator